MRPNRAPHWPLAAAYSRKLPHFSWIVRTDKTASNCRFSVRRYSRGKRSIAAYSSHRQTLSPLRSAGIDNLLAVASRHPGTKAVRSLSLEHAGLECALHDDRPQEPKGSGILRSTIQSVNLVEVSLVYGQEGLLLLVGAPANCVQPPFRPMPCGALARWLPVDMTQRSASRRSEFSPKYGT